MDSLPERIEAAEGPSRELDYAIMVATATPETRTYWNPCGDEHRYTSSIDAAIKLVPEGWDYVITAKTGELVRGTVADLEVIRGKAATPALALCAAALRAKEQPNEG